VLAQWSRAAIPALFSAADAARRERVVNAIVATMRRAAAERRERRRVHVMTGAVAAAVVGLLLLAAGVQRGRGAGTVVGHLHAWTAAPHAVAPVSQPEGPPGAPSTRSAALPPASRAPAASVHESPSRLQLRSGVQVAMGPETRLSPPDREQPTGDREELVLDSGFIRVDVPKLPGGHTLQVRTPDTLVVVHGTSFSVEVTRAGLSAAPVTKVAVSSGVVTVRHAQGEVLLGAGMQWASSDEVSPVASSHSVAPPSRVMRRREREPTAATSVASPVPNATPAMEPATEETDLAEQNRLFAEAMLARERGDLAASVRILDTFAGRYPGSVLAQDACVETFRVLARSGDRAAAARAARRYLTLYQNGFARDEARALALEPGP
jgi:hypothetical protein